MKITSFTRAEHTRLSRAIDAALSKVADDFGVDLSCGGGVYGDNNPHIKIRVTVRDNGSGMTTDEVSFRRWAAMYGMQPDWYGKTVVIDRTAYEICGIKTNAPKYTVQVKRCHDQRVFGCPVSTVTRQLGIKAAA
ncbi:hypothetical protein B9J07_27900 [Sinorhizobium sp. LM21]|uniref:hypothetical protein n=1 Tax=Sinorhizobium sp. LM21 TaxID=1449788 RepID=UPI0005D7A4FD|nr:hypothetical protein [Sinorhizobium sp. LM21]AJW30183.1 hypothetical protein pLM21S1_p63 [Sinorhizobium sp. LM21]OWZ90413.1 hypothetical protein B9J07_27900 [Sinorhizobium sp. LM21]